MPLLRRRWSLPLAALCLLLALGVGVAALSSWQQARAALSAQQAAREQADTRQRAAQRLLQRIGPAFAQLQQRGVLGRGPLPWLAKVEQARRALRLPQPHYRILAVEPLPAEQGSLRAYAGVLELHTALWHALDLPDLLERLTQAGAQPLHLESCSLRRRGGTEPPALEAHCRLRWYGLLLPGEPMPRQVQER